MAQNLSKAKIAKLTYKHTKVAKIFNIIYPSLISYQFVKAWYCFSNLRQNTKLCHTRCNRAGKNNALVLHINLTSKMAAKLSFQSNRVHWDNAAPSMSAIFALKFLLWIYIELIESSTVRYASVNKTILYNRY